MKGDRIQYRSGYLYQITRDYRVQTDIIPDREYYTPFFNFYHDGELFVMAGYAYDGPSGITLDTADSMRAALIHDCGYQCIREYGMPRSFRKQWDQEFLKVLLEDGMEFIRARTWYRAVRMFGKSSTKGDGGKPIQEAP